MSRYRSGFSQLYMISFAVMAALVAAIHAFSRPPEQVRG